MMELVIEAVKRLVLSIFMITIANMFIGNQLAFSVFNILAVAIFSFPGLLIVIFMSYFII